MLSRFHLIPERHGRADRQTDRIGVSYRASVCWRAIQMKSSVIIFFKYRFILRRCWGLKQMLNKMLKQYHNYVGEVLFKAEVYILGTDFPRDDWIVIRHCSRMYHRHLKLGQHCHNDIITRQTCKQFDNPVQVFEYILQKQTSVWVLLNSLSTTDIDLL